jgi:hypothetical protein
MSQNGAPHVAARSAPTLAARVVSAAVTLIVAETAVVLECVPWLRSPPGHVGRPTGGLERFGARAADRCAGSARNPRDAPLAVFEPQRVLRPAATEIARAKREQRGRPPAWRLRERRSGYPPLPQRQL